MQVPEKFENVTAVCKANVYNGGKVVSHTLWFADGSRKTLGIMFPGSYHFNTDAPERMEIIAGACSYKLAEQDAGQTCEAGSFFDLPGNASFEISVADGIMEYVCTYK